MVHKTAFAFRFTVVAASIINFSAPAAAQESCAALKAMSQAADAFASLRGEQLPGGGWRAKFIPAGFKGCTVEDRKGDAAIACTNDFTESDKPAALMAPVAAQFKECIGSGWNVRRVLGTSEEVSILVIYNESPVEFELRFEKEHSSVADAMGLATTAWKYRVSLKAFTPGRDEPPLPLMAHDAKAFCATLSALLTAAPDAFKGVKGKQLSERSWQPTQMLQGLKDCHVAQLPSGTTYYTCKTEFESRTALAAAQRQLASESVKCLGTEWHFSRQPKGDGVWRYSVTREESGPMVSIRGRYDDGIFRLNFDVDAE